MSAGHDETQGAAGADGVRYEVYVDPPTDKRLQILAAREAVGTTRGYLERLVHEHVYGRLPELPAPFAAAEAEYLKGQEKTGGDDIERAALPYPGEPAALAAALKSKRRAASTAWTENAMDDRGASVVDGFEYQR